MQLISRDVDDNPVLARVIGSGRSLYSVEISRDKTGLYGECSCPVGFDCKHAAATALAWLEHCGAVTRGGVSKLINTK
ncbi:SWIM zinc finger family protein [Marinobacterium sp. D7]|nr:SWIM zinc finger family protein [Marinobacterium ramblicola]